MRSSRRSAPAPSEWARIIKEQKNGYDSSRRCRRPLSDSGQENRHYRIRFAGPRTLPEFEGQRLHRLCWAASAEQVAAESGQRGPTVKSNADAAAWADVIMLL